MQAPGTALHCAGQHLAPGLPTDPLPWRPTAGVRSFELDGYWDPAGGVYAQAAGLRISGQPGFLTDPKYKQPGFKVRCSADRSRALALWWNVATKLLAAHPPFQRPASLPGTPTAAAGRPPTISGPATLLLHRLAAGAACAGL